MRTRLISGAWKRDLVFAARSPKPAAVTRLRRGVRNIALLGLENVWNLKRDACPYGIIPAMHPDSSTTSWNGIADQWVSHADQNDYRLHFLLPLTLDLLGEVRGRRVLDLGCGEGGYARELARRGAIVTGIDGSERLVEVARERSTPAGLNIDFFCLNANHLDSLVDASFDAVLAAMSLMDVEDYPGAVAEAHRVLRPGGELLMSITHPCFTGPVSEWVRDEQGNGLHFKVDRYFERAAWEDHIAKGFWTAVVRRHRPLEDYMQALLAAGFRLRDFREPVPTADQMKLSRRFWKIQRIPYFLFMRWSKP